MEDTADDGASLGPWIVTTDAPEHGATGSQLSGEGELLRSVLDAVPHPVTVRDREGRFRLANRAAAALFGLEPRDVEGRTLFDLPDCVAPEMAARLHQEDLEAMDAGRPVSSEMVVTTRAGERRIFEVQRTPLSGPGGIADRVLTVATEVTAHRTQEQELRAGEQRLRLALEAGRMGLWDWDLESNRSVWNRREHELLGLPPGEGEVDADVFFARVHPEDLEELQATISRALAGGSDFWHEFRVIREDGAVRWLAGRGTVVRDEVSGRALRMLGVNYDVTEAQEAAQRIAASEHRFRAIVDRSWDGVTLRNAGGRLLYASPALGRLLDEPMEALPDGCPPDRIHPDDMARVGTEVATVHQEPGSSRTLRFRVRRSDDSLRWVELSATNLLHDPDIAAVVYHFRDITERREADERLRGAAEEAQARLRQEEAIARLTRIALATRELDPLLEQVAQEVAAILGDDYVEILQAVEPDDGFVLRASAGDSTGAPADGSLDAGSWSFGAYVLGQQEPVVVESFGAETRFEAPPRLLNRGIRGGVCAAITGRNRPFSLIGSYSRNARTYAESDRNFLHAVANIVAAAIERTRLEKELLQESAFAATVMSALPGLVCVFDGDLRVLNWNSALQEATGYRADQLAGMSLLDLVAPDESGRIQASFRQLFQTGRSATEGYLVTKSGARMPYLFSGVRMDTQEGPRFLGVGLDLSEHRRLESQLRQAQKMEAIGRLAGGVAHDFNNLLTVIGGYTDLLLHQISPDDPVRPALAEIQRASEHARDLTRQLLAFSRRQVQELAVLDLNRVVSSTEKMLRRVIGEDVLVATRLDPDLGRVRADAGQVQQVLMNLAVNARDAMPRGGRLTIETTNVELDRPEAARRGLEPGPFVLLTVTDTGIGMDEETRSRIFEPFFTTKGPGEGTGLGLATVHGIVRQSGGYVEAYSSPGLGTSFKIYLPRVNAAETPLERASEGAKPALGSETVLLAEDEPALRNLARMVLAEHGYTVLEAADGREALAIAESAEQPIDLLISDVVMPHLGGRELAERVRAIRPECRVLFTSGYTDDAVLRHGVLEAGVAFLRKPYRPAELVEKVRETLDREPAAGGSPD